MLKKTPFIKIFIRNKLLWAYFNAGLTVFYIEEFQYLSCSVNSYSSYSDLFDFTFWQA
jgi:hypothetical protein